MTTRAQIEAVLLPSYSQRAKNADVEAFRKYLRQALTQERFVPGEIVQYGDADDDAVDEGFLNGNAQRDAAFIAAAMIEGFLPVAADWGPRATAILWPSFVGRWEEEMAERRARMAKRAQSMEIPFVPES